MEDAAIRDRILNISNPAPIMATFYRAALCRAGADWLVGINATRLFFLFLYGDTLNVGRVMTPTLALIVRREARANHSEQAFLCAGNHLRRVYAAGETGG